MYNLEEFVTSEEEFTSFRKALSHGEGIPALRCAKIKVTPRCNLHCVMCKYWRTSGLEELSTDAIMALLKSLKHMGCRKIHFSGGELLMRGDIFDILNAAAEKGFKVNFTTNGTLINRKLARKIIRAGINSISLSLDAPDAHLHDRIRGTRGAFNRTIRAIRLLGEARSERKTKIRINTVIQKKNYTLIPGIMELAGSLGAKDVRLMPVDGKGASRWNLSKTEIKNYNEKIAPETARIRQKYGFPADERSLYPFGREKDDLNLSRNSLYALGFYQKNLCYAPWLHTFIAWDGNVYLCCMSRGATEPLGNVYREPLEAIFRGERYSAQRRQFLEKRLPICDYCDDFIRENTFLRDIISGDGE